MSSKSMTNNTLNYGFVRLVVAKPFLDELKRRGISFESSIASLGLSASDFEDPTRYVHAETIYTLFNTLAATAQDPHLGYHVGSRLDFAEWPPFKTAVRKANTVGEFMTEFISTVPSEANSVKHELSVTSEGACYRVVRLIKTEASPRHTEAFGVALFIRLFQAIAGSTWKPEQVSIKSAYSDALPKLVQDARVSRKLEGGLELCFPTEWLYKPIQLNSVFKARKIPETATVQEAPLFEPTLLSARSHRLLRSSPFVHPQVHWIDLE